MRFWAEREPFLTRFAASHRVLHLGPGRDAVNGVSVDLRRAVDPTVVADLEEGLPFREAAFDAVYAISVVEHVRNLLLLMGEIHRVLKPGGFVAILTPHFSDDASFVDPTHCNHLSARSFDYLLHGAELSDRYGFYSSARFRTLRRLLMLKPPMNRVPGLQWLCNRYVGAWERHWCYLVRGAGIYWELEAAKE